mgnify:CR=1 FL=1
MLVRECRRSRNANWLLVPHRLGAVRLNLQRPVRVGAPVLRQRQPDRVPLLGRHVELDDRGRLGDEPAESLAGESEAVPIVPAEAAG